MKGTNTSSSSKRSLKGTSSANLCGPHDSSSRGLLSDRHAGGGCCGRRPSRCEEAAAAMSDEQLSCSHSRDTSSSSKHTPNSLYIEQWSHVNLNKKKAAILLQQRERKRNRESKSVSLLSYLSSMTDEDKINLYFLKSFYLTFFGGKK